MYEINLKKKKKHNKVINFIIDVMGFKPINYRLGVENTFLAIRMSKDQFRGVVIRFLKLIITRLFSVPFLFH